jgi:hypothetical protein
MSKKASYVKASVTSHGLLKSIGSDSLESVGLGVFRSQQLATVDRPGVGDRSILWQSVTLVNNRQRK